MYKNLVILIVFVYSVAIAKERYNIEQTCACAEKEPDVGCIKWDCNGDIEHKVECLSLDTLLMTPDGERKAGDLKPGDSVYALQNGKIIEDRIYDNLHYEPDTKTTMLEIILSNNKTLVLTPRHIVFLETGEPVFANTLKPADCLMSSLDYSQFIVDIRKVKKVGIIAPLTYTGTYLVGGAMVSNYAETDYHYLAHYWSWPMRVYHGIFGEASGLHQGMHPYAKFSHELVNGHIPSIEKRSSSSSSSSGSSAKKRKMQRMMGTFTGSMMPIISKKAK